MKAQQHQPEEPFDYLEGTSTTGDNGELTRNITVPEIDNENNAWYTAGKPRRKIIRARITHDKSDA